tara:strand:+ start:382 stop:738 length:357 start_codon:yes stop_codon:yes gene_type:complete
MKMRVAIEGVKGPSKVCAIPLPKTFMKYLALLIVGASISYGQQFKGTIVDLDSGRIQVINGRTETEYKPYQPQIDAYTKIIADNQARIDRMVEESEAREQTHQLRMQTEYLRRIAEKE